jgi:SPP1 family predicted phage head-tail adaptor
MYKEVINFISTTETNDHGDLIKSKTKREVFANIKSIGQSEFYQAQAVGLKPEIKFVIADYEDYQNEKLLEYDGKEYQVMRTYRDGTKLEITCKGDVNVCT